MRDIGRRIQRYRLTRYALPDDPVRRRLRWLWLIAVIWLGWVGVVSDHSLWRIWKLSRERARVTRELERAEAERQRLEAERKDPQVRRDQAERKLREENGMARPGEIIYVIRDVPADSLQRR